MTEWLHFQFSLSCFGEGNGNPLQCSCLENPRCRGAWWAAVYGVAQSRTRLKRLSSSSSIAVIKGPQNLISRARGTKGSSKPWLKGYIWFSPLCPMASLWMEILFHSWDPCRLLALVSRGRQILFQGKELLFSCNKRSVTTAEFGRCCAHPWGHPTECEWCTVIRVMTPMGNDLKNFSNEISSRSLERPVSTNPFWSLGSERTSSGVKLGTFKACFDMALNKEEQVSTSDFYSFTAYLKKGDRLISFVRTATVLNFWPARGHWGDFADGGQGRFLIVKLWKRRGGKDLYGGGFWFWSGFQFSRKVPIRNSSQGQTLWPKPTTIQ